MPENRNINHSGDKKDIHIAEMKQKTGLLLKKADIEAKDNNGEMALHQATQNEHEAVVVDDGEVGDVLN